MKDSAIDKNWVKRNFKFKKERIVLPKSLNLKNVNVRDLADGELRIVEENSTVKLLIKSNNKLYSCILTEET